MKYDNKSIIKVMLFMTFFVLSFSLGIAWAEQKGTISPRDAAWADFYEEWDPFEEMERIQERMNRMFNNSFDRRGFTQPRTELSPGSAYFSPNVDIREADDSYVIEYDLPGMEKDKIDVSINGNILTVRGERKNEEQEEREDAEGGYSYYRRERIYGSFERSIPLPEDADTEKLTAKYDNGVLVITVRRKERQTPIKGKKIEVM